MLSPYNELINAAKSGSVVSFPTDTVPALAVDPQKTEAIYQLKQRSLDKPLILMGASPDDLWHYVEGTPDERQTWQELANQHWPGALTLVLPASAKVPAGMNPSGSGTLGIRVPDCAIAQKLLSVTGPLATTSANRSGEPPLREAAAIAAAFPSVCVLEPEAYQNRLGSGLPSTVVQWTGGDWRILRQGAVEL
ncbi:Sua5/YciO/YrdC/YwlC family protein [Geitlerinema sp. P-1104]|uniref:L-threonylcarbamoyladenylate synthase n=1 Tax=Geitlerinema sp. P-1104 TaxID=2546230 RepID=UPI00147779D7|nr:L-threonylcarbamoyladenylate synthase [Geitlerinema sp. P-1104]NMG60411.1 Sua5/YciO/YrdC/YwlC family protein [Geitlerinema sp. P-1104]